MASVHPNQDPIRTQLQSIFLPHATNKIRGLYEAIGFTHARFVHYTSAEAALKIIKSKRIWMRNTTCMSDYSEVMHGYSILWKFFSNDKNKAKNDYDLCSKEYDIIILNS